MVVPLELSPVLVALRSVWLTVPLVIVQNFDVQPVCRLTFQIGLLKLKMPI